MFDSLTRKLQFRFKDRISAANILGEALKDVIPKEEKFLVLGIPRGGLVTADIVARKSGAPLDIIIPRKLTDIDNKEHAIGAVMEDGITYIDEETVKFLRIDQEYIEKEKAYQIQEIRWRCTGSHLSITILKTRR
jgi:putative phosphoribosyl transferase